jgi:hypothetical protein
MLELMAYINTNERPNRQEWIAMFTKLEVFLNTSI